MPTVRDATFDVMRRHGMTRIFGNPGSTELTFLKNFSSDFDYILGLQEASAVAMRRRGFDVDMVEDATRADMVRAIESLKLERAKGSAPLPKPKRPPNPKRPPKRARPA